MRVQYQLQGLTLSAIEAQPAETPRGIVLALHGGGSSAGYWDFPPTSLLAIAANRNYLGVAIDRPGYRDAYHAPMPLRQQAEIVLDLIEYLQSLHGKLPVVLAGHSMGGILALVTAADPRAEALICAIDASGVPLRYPDPMQASLSARRIGEGQTHFPPLDPAHAMQMFFAAANTYRPDAIAFANALACPVPAAEMPDAANAPRDLPAIMQRIVLPVRLTFAALEQSSLVDEDIAAHARTNLKTSRDALVRYEPNTGHNISLHLAGGAYHVGIADWLEKNMARGATARA